MTDNNPDGGASFEVVVFEEKIDKIRSQLNSKLDNQKHLALILSAVEENLTESNTEKSPVAYFVSFLSLLEQAVSEEEVLDAGVATSAAYLLDVALPATPAPLLKQKFGQILTRMAPVLTNPSADAPLVKSSIGSLETLLLTQDSNSWASSGTVSPRRALVGLLELSFDPRPKVRKRAVEAVQKILSNPPPSPSATHVAAPLCGELALKRLIALIKDAPKSRRPEKNKESNAAIIHCLQLITAITSAQAWPSSKVESLCDTLLEVSKTSDQFLVSAAFSAFNGLFTSLASDIKLDEFTRVLDIIFDLKPSVNDSHLAASWLAVVAKGLETFSRLLPEACLKKLNVIITSVAAFLSSESRDIYTSASQCLIAVVTQAIPDEYLLQPSQDNNISPEIYELVDDVISFIAEFAGKELLSIKYQHATKEVLEFVTAAILKLRSRANPDFLEVLETVGQWRTDENADFPHNSEAEDLIAACISTMGPEVVLGVLPLNLTGSRNNEPGRAWLLPLLRDNVRFASLEYYKRDILPLIEFFTQKIDAASKKEVMHVKIFQTIAEQVWSLLPHFCDLPKDLRTAFDDDFAAALADLLYSKVELRTTICHALRLLAESNFAYSQGAMADDLMMQQEFPISEATQNLEYLSGKASNLLSVLFNVFSSTLPDSRGYILETIDIYLQVISQEDLQITFDKVCGLLKNAMDEEAQDNTPPKKNEPPKLSVTMMDLIVAMAKYVPSTAYNALFAIFSNTVTMDKNPMMQKRSYRIITKLYESENGQNALKHFLNEIETVIVQNVGTTHTSSRATRMAAIEIVLELLPSSDLHFIPSILQEIIMTTKDVNEKSRMSAFNILVHLGAKMAEGGVIRNNLIPGFPEDAQPSEASLIEFFTMASAGLASQSQHMIAATIIALSRLLFEFKDALPEETIIELASTVELFLTSNSREIARAAVGFVKVEILSLPEEYIRSNLSELLTKLMRWSHEHRDHFKSKVKHIIERLMRRIGTEEVERAVPEEDRKLVANIKKTKNRAKKQKGTDEDDEEGKRQGKKFVSAYDEALHSESEDESEDEEPAKKSSRKNKGADRYILENGDDPLNLLDRQTLAHISSSKPKKFSKKDMEKHQVETKNGKVVFKENDDPLADKGTGIDAYVDALKQQPVRGQKNRMKFKKPSKEDNWSDDEEEAPAVAAKAKTQSKGRVGKPKQKFKAKKKL